MPSVRVWEIFDTHRRTCLRPHWSRRGIGYFLLQQHCSCPSGIPDCCPGGWRISLAGSRFLSSAEQRYAAIEGEALAVAWSEIISSSSLITSPWSRFLRSFSIVDCSFIVVIKVNFDHREGSFFNVGRIVNVGTRRKST